MGLRGILKRRHMNVVTEDIKLTGVAKVDAEDTLKGESQ